MRDGERGGEQDREQRNNQNAAPPRSPATLKQAQPGVNTALHTFYRMISSFGAVSAGMPAAAAAALDVSNDALMIATCPSRTSTG